MPVLDVNVAPELDPAVAPFLYAMQFGRGRLARLLQGATPEQLATRPAGFKNSMAAVLMHVGAANVNFAHWMLGKPVPADLKAEFLLDQPESPMPQPEGETVESLQAKLDKSVGIVREAMATVKASDLERPVTIGGDTQVTMRWLLSLVAYHCSDHFGQLQMIKQHL